MTEPAPEQQDVPGRYTVAQYFDLVRQGVLQPDDRVELLEGVKSRMYAAAGIPEYWIVSRRDDAVEVFRDPDSGSAIYRSRRLVLRDESLELVALEGVHVAAADMLPPPAPNDARA